MRPYCTIHAHTLIALLACCKSSLSLDLDAKQIDFLLGEVRLLTGQAHGKPKANWIWTSKTAGKQRCYFRRGFAIDDLPAEAWLYARGDNSARAFVNGEPVRLGATPGARPWSYLHARVTDRLRPGINMVSVECVNSDGPGGLVGVLDMRYGQTVKHIVTDASWHVTETRPVGWPGAAPAQWIWAHRTADRQTCYFHRVVQVDRAPSAAQLYARIDDSGAVFVNGDKISLARSPGHRGYSLLSADVSDILRPGTNVISAECRNGVSYAGLIALLDVDLAGVLTQVATDSSWRVSETRPATWPQRVSTDEGNWQPARVLGPAGMPPWGYVGGYPTVANLGRVPPGPAKWTAARILGPAGGEPWGAVEAYPVPYRPRQAAADAGTQIALDWLTQDRREIARGVTFAELALAHLGRAQQLLREFGSDLAGESARLRELRAKCTDGSPAGHGEAALRLYLTARALKREIALKNPLLDFDELLFIKQYFPRSYHEQSHRLGRLAIPGGGLYTLKGLSPSGKLQDVTGGALPVGNFWRPDLSFDAKKILFCYRAPKGPAFHIYEIGTDGTGLRQLTNSRFDDLDPIYLPNGKIMFTSTRGLTYVRCNPESRAYVLCTMEADGSNVKVVSHNNECDWTPCLMPDGRVLFTRWEYTDRALWRLQKLWTTNPDGSGTRIFWGNHSEKPDCLAEARPVPNSSRVVFCGVGHHQYFQGSLGLIDPRKGLDFPLGLTPVTPEVAWPEVERDKGAGAYKSPFPLSDRFFIASYGYDSRAFKPGGADFGIYLIDVLGSKELIYRDPKLNSYYAIPVRPRPRPPIVPDSRPDGETAGALFNPDVYAGIPGVPRGKHCVSCHSPKGQAGKRLDLTFRKTKFFAQPYETLIARQIAYVYPSEPAYWKDRARDVYAVAKPFEYLSPKSKLVANASSGRHHGVKADPAEIRQLVAGIDSNGPFHGLQEARKQFPDAPVSARP